MGIDASLFESAHLTDEKTEIKTVGNLISARKNFNF
jgi:hypothetical protein